MILILILMLKRSLLANACIVCCGPETSAKTSENTNGALETIARDAFLMSLNRTCLLRTVFVSGAQVDSLDSRMFLLL